MLARRPATSRVEQREVALYARLGRFVVVALVAATMVHLTAPRVAAECTQSDPWPSFRGAAPTAARIVVGEVVEDRDPNSDLYVAVFGLRVDTVLRGPPYPENVIEIRHLHSGLPRVICESVARVLIGDVVAFAFDARDPTGRPINAFAYIRGVPNEMVPGIERITWDELALLTRPSLEPEPQTGSIAGPIVVLIGVLLAVVGLGLFVRRRSI